MTPIEITAEEILLKVAAGLTKDQAIEAITNQRLHDASLEAVEAAAEEKLVELQTKILTAKEKAAAKKAAASA